MSSIKPETYQLIFKDAFFTSECFKCGENCHWGFNLSGTCTRLRRLMMLSLRQFLNTLSSHNTVMLIGPCLVAYSLLLKFMGSAFSCLHQCSSFQVALRKNSITRSGKKSVSFNLIPVLFSGRLGQSRYESHSSHRPSRHYSQSENSGKDRIIFRIGAALFNRIKNVLGWRNKRNKQNQINFVKFD